ncbi:hypothetical protein GCM10026983_09250 [Gracilibacillus alcaliphilus]
MSFLLAKIDVHYKKLLATDVASAYAIPLSGHKHPKLDRDSHDLKSMPLDRLMH